MTSLSTCLLLTCVLMFLSREGCFAQKAKTSKPKVVKPIHKHPHKVKFFTINGSDSNKLTWTEAYLFCRASNSYLASIDNQEEYMNLKDHLKKIPAAAMKNKRFWVGGGRASSYEWTWADTGKTLGFTPWAPGQPNYQGTCLELSSTSAKPKQVDKKNKNANPFLGGPLLYIASCEKKNNFICHSFITVHNVNTQNPDKKP